MLFILVIAVMGVIKPTRNDKHYKPGHHGPGGVIGKPTRNDKYYKPGHHGPGGVIGKPGGKPSGKPGGKPSGKPERWGKPNNSPAHDMGRHPGNHPINIQNLHPIVKPGTASRHQAIPMPHVAGQGI